MFEIYFDEDSQRHGAADAARRAGFVCLTALEADRLGLTDEEQLRFAAETGRVLLTRNYVHFVRLHGEWMDAGRSHAGIIVVISQRTEPGAQTHGLLNIAAMYSPEEMRDQILFLGNWVRSSAPG